MHRGLSIFIFAAASLPMFAQEPARTSTVTFGAGGNFVTGGNIASSYSNGPAITTGYEFRVQKYLSIEAAMDNSLPEFSTYHGYGVSTYARVHNTFLPFGVRGVLPFHNGRIEAYAGGGGAYLWHGGYRSQLSIGLPDSINRWLWQVNAGARLALDKQRRFWLGATVRYYRDGQGSSSEQYLSWTGDIGFRFGR